jgi:cytochrome d ubiquinol oxidase subunit II
MTAATAVAAIIAGWGLAARPQLLPGLTIQQAAAGRPVIIATLIGLGIGALLLVPSLALLYTLVLRGRFDEQEADAPPRQEVRPRTPPRELPLLPAAGICLVAGVVATVAFDSAWGRIIGIPLLLAFIALGFVALVSGMTAETG